jgi:multiple sugar transport system permease protein
LKSLVTTGTFVVIGVPLTMAIGLALALALNSGVKHLRATYRAAFYLPVITNIVAAAVIWQYAFTLNGPVNALLASAGLTGPNWLGDPNMAITTVILLTTWRNLGTCMVLFLAGLQTIPTDVYEAAAIDGASPRRSFWSITLPLLRPATALVTVLMTVSYMNIFDEPYLLTKGGPVGSTRSVALWVFEQFGQGNIASAMAGSYVMLAIVVVLGLLQLRMLRTAQ